MSNYFGKKLGASSDGRKAYLPIPDGTSPSHGSDRNGPTAVIKSLAKTGYSDYFVDLDEYHQNEIIARTAQEAV